MIQVVFKKPRRSRYDYYSRQYSAKCNICKRTLKVGESVIKLSADHATGLHRSCVERWLDETPWEGEGAQREATLAKQDAEFKRIRNKLIREQRAQKKAQCEDQSKSST